MISDDISLAVAAVVAAIRARDGARLGAALSALDEAAERVRHMEEHCGARPPAAIALRPEWYQHAEGRA